MSWAPQRAVIDTGVLLNRLIRPDSTPARALTLALLRGPLLASNETLEELRTVLVRPKFDRYLSREQRMQFFEEFTRIADPVLVRERVVECRDARDNKFLEVAINGGASVVVTGDDDLLVMDPWRSVRIVTPATFLRITP